LEVPLPPQLENIAANANMDIKILFTISYF
jgi:hypothetical protein